MHCLLVGSQAQGSDVPGGCLANKSGNLCSEHMNEYTDACGPCADAVPKACIDVCCCQQPKLLSYSSYAIVNHTMVERYQSPVFGTHQESQQRLFWWASVRQQLRKWSANHVMTQVSLVQDELEAAKREQEQRQHLCSGVRHPRWAEAAEDQISGLDSPSLHSSGPAARPLHSCC